MRPNATLVISGNLETPKVLVPLARPGFIKSTKVKYNVSNAAWENRTLMPKHPAVIVTLVDLAAGKVIVKHAQLDSIKIPNTKQSAVIPVTC